jgi:hypothetical protein
MEKNSERFSLQELLEFFRPHTIQLGGISSACNLVPMKLRLISLAWATKHKQAPSVCNIDAQSSTSEQDSLAAIKGGADIIAGALLRSENALVYAPFLVRTAGLRGQKGSRVHQYEVWDCVAEPPSDPILLLELYAAAEALHRNTGVMAHFVYVAVADGPQLAFDTTELKRAFEEVKRLYATSRIQKVRTSAPNQILSFRQRKTQDIR